MVAPCPLFIYCVHVWMCGGGCVWLPVGSDVGVCVQCVNLGLVGLLRHDPDYVGPCLLNAFSSVTLLSHG